MGTKVITVAGTNGAGKTTTMRKVMEYMEADFKTKHTLDCGVLINVYKSAVVIGSYDRVCGGADTVKRYSSVWEAVLECAEHNNVLYEGVLVSNVYSPAIELSNKLKKIGSVFIPIGLNTNFEQCVANTNIRRAAAGKEALEDSKNIEISYKKSRAAFKKFYADGLNPYWVSSDEAVQIILKEIGYAE